MRKRRMVTDNPILIDVTRGPGVESRHRGVAIIVDCGGKILAQWGDIDTPIYPRSAIKPLQALPLVTSGAADAKNISEAELAIACASHMAGRQHVDLVGAWLKRLGLSDNDLVCGAIPPGDADEAASLIKSGDAPRRAHNNCSGKHTGFLTTALHLGLPTQDYAEATGQEQQEVRALLSRLGGYDLSRAAHGIDGCGLPTIPMPPVALAQACARMATPETLEESEANAARRILAAMSAHPEMIRGPGEFDTIAITAAKGSFVTKVGAEGVSAAIVPARGLGIAIKVDDGARRAADVAMAYILDALGLLDDDARTAFSPWLPETIPNTLGARAGEVRPSEQWQEELSALS